MNLYIKKSEREDSGGQRGGRYVARVRVGYGPKNEPTYRHFRTVESYKTYLDNASQAKKEKKPKKDKKPKEPDLQDKIKQENKDKPGPDKKPSLFVKPKKEKKK